MKSFEDAETAALMNKHFINIKVDREERPDLDHIYMNAVVATTGHGGWPMSVFLTPEGQPFYGGTYFPPVSRHNLPSFRDVLSRIIQVWSQDQEQILVSAAKITEYLKNAENIPENRQSPGTEDLDQAVQNLSQAFDWKFGGWGSAPKFPQPLAIEFLLRRARRGDPLASDMALQTLDAMARGGMYDAIGGGFSRYSTDNDWKVPHFEKMLYDNAQLALVYLHAFLLTGRPEYREIVVKTLDFMTRELSDPGGGFYSSLDADSEGEEGKYYVWSLAELRAILEDNDELELFAAAYGVTERGNFEGKNILQRVLPDEAIAKRFDLPVQDVAPRLEGIHQQLLAYRQLRIPPAKDDKVICLWNALALITFSEAARYLDRTYLQVAVRCGSFLKEHLYQNGLLLRSWRNGKAQHPAYLEDYAALTLAFLSLYQSDPNPEWFQWACRLGEDLLQNFRSLDGGFFDTSEGQQGLILRPRDFQDNTTPSGNALAASALLQLSSYAGRMEWRELAEDQSARMTQPAIRYPTAFAYWLCVDDLLSNPGREVAIVGDPADPATRSLEEVLWSQYRPDIIVARSAYPIAPGSPMLLEGRGMVNNLPTAYVCENMACLLPVNDPQDLLRQLEPGREP